MASRETLPLFAADRLPAPRATDRVTFLAEVFGTTPENILVHLRNVFAVQKVNGRATTKDFLGVRT